MALSHPPTLQRHRHHLASCSLLTSSVAVSKRGWADCRAGSAQQGAHCRHDGLREYRAHFGNGAVRVADMWCSSSGRLRDQDENGLFCACWSSKLAFTGSLSHELLLVLLLRAAHQEKPLVSCLPVASASPKLPQTPNQARKQPRNSILPRNSQK